MSMLTIRLPAGLKRMIEQIAASEGRSVDLFMASPAAERVAKVIAMRARREYAAGRRKDLDKYLAAIPDLPPLPADEK